MWSTDDNLRRASTGLFSISHVICTDMAIVLNPREMRWYFDIKKRFAISIVFGIPYNNRILALWLLQYRSWDKVFVVLHGSSLSCYKDQKHAKSVSAQIIGLSISTFCFWVIFHQTGFVSFVSYRLECCWKSYFCILLSSVNYEGWEWWS